LYKSGNGRDLPSSMVEKISDILLAIEEAEHPDEVGLFPGWRLHPLKGELKGFWSVTVSGNWRVIFRFEDGDAFDLDFVDYH
jgi:toxin HigB-1